MTNLKVLTSERLNQLISQTQIALNELKEEVERREQAKQEHQIENLESHMKSAELSLTSIRNFI
ncbi:hypothetical protein N8878_07990, partial [Psychromonas sp.]|nr:hypothetical protein [Psychromonas sp.]